MTYSLDTLEWRPLLDLVARGCQTPMGRTRVLSFRPLASRIEVNKALAAVSETIALSEEQVTWSFSGLEDPSEAVAILRIENAALEPTVLLEIARVCSQALFARSAIQPEKDAAPNVWAVVESIPPTLLAVVDQINKRSCPAARSTIPHRPSWQNFAAR